MAKKNTNPDYNATMKEAIAEYKQWLKDRKTDRLATARKAAAIRRATLKARKVKSYRV